MADGSSTPNSENAVFSDADIQTIRTSVQELIFGDAMAGIQYTDDDSDRSIKTRNKAWKLRANKYPKPITGRILYIQQIIHIGGSLSKYAKTLGETNYFSLMLPFSAIIDENARSIIEAVVVANSLVSDFVFGDPELMTNSQERIYAGFNVKNYKDLSNITYADAMDALVKGVI